MAAGIKQIPIRGVEVFRGGVPPGSLNPEPISDQKCHDFSHQFSDQAPKKFMPSLTLRLEQQQKFLKSISNSHISLSFSLIWN